MSRAEPGAGGLRRTLVALLGLGGVLVASPGWAALATDGLGGAVVDVRPLTWQLGDTIVVETRSTLAPAGGGCRVRLEGKFTPPLRGDRPVLLPARWAGGGRLLVTLDGEAQRTLGPSRRFRGELFVDRLDGEVVWRGAGRVVELELFPKTLRGEAASLVARVLAWRLTRGQVAAAEEIVAVNGVSVTSPEETLRAARRAVVVGAGARPIELTVRTAGCHEPSADSTRTLRIAPGMVPGEEVDAFGMAVVLILVGLAILLPIGPVAGIIVVAERKIAGRIQSRYGPNRVGPGGWLQWLADGIKLILKEDTVPTDADPWLFRLSPYLVFMGLFATFVALPLSERLIVANLNIGVLYLTSVTSLVVVGILMGGWASNSKWSLLGGMRSAAQIMSYELPASMALLTVVLLAGSLSTEAIVRGQGGFPWQWNLFHGPWTLVAFVIYFVSALAEGNRIPFDLPEAESELVSGYNTEYSGFRFSIYFLTEWTNLLVIGCVVTALFLGGWQIPGVSADAVGQSLVLQLLGAALFLAKASSLVFVIIWIRWTLPRLRVDQMMNLCWKFFIPISLVSFLVLAAWLWLVPPLVQRLLQGALFVLVGLGGTAYFARRVRYNLRTVGADLPPGGEP